MPATSAGMTVESHLHKLWHRGFSVDVLRHACCRSVRERCRAAHPGGLSCQIFIRTLRTPNKEGSGAPKFAGAERRTHWSVLRSDLSLQREGLPVHARAGAPFGAPLRRFSLDLETAFWKRTGASLRYALDSAEFFALRSSAPTSPLPDRPT